MVGQVSGVNGLNILQGKYEFDKKQIEGVLLVYQDKFIFIRKRIETFYVL